MWKRSYHGSGGCTLIELLEFSIPLSSQVRQGLGHIDPYFVKLADGMVAWIEGWRLLNPAKVSA